MTAGVGLAMSGPMAQTRIDVLVVGAGPAARPRPICSPPRAAVVVCDRSAFAAQALRRLLTEKNDPHRCGGISDRPDRAAVRGRHRACHPQLRVAGSARRPSAGGPSTTLHLTRPRGYRSLLAEESPGSRRGISSQAAVIEIDPAGLRF